MDTEVVRLLGARRRWRMVLLLAMLSMAVGIALLATSLRGVASPLATTVMFAMFGATLLACIAWWRHFRAYVAIKRLQRKTGSP